MLTLRKSLCEDIAERDPFDADRWYDALPIANRAADIGFLIDLLRLITRRSERIADGQPAVVVAALRDAGMVLGSLRRHAIEPAAAVPGVERLLVSWSHAVDM